MERTSAWPSQSAITVVSTPAWSSDIAQLWRSTCGCSVLAVSDGQAGGGGLGVGADASLDGVAAEAPAGAGGEQRVGGAAGAFGEPGARARLGVGGERDGALLSALAVAADVRAGAERDVAAVEADQFGDAQPGLDGERQHGVVAATFPAVAVGRVDAARWPRGW